MCFYVDLRLNFDSSYNFDCKLQLCWAHNLCVSCCEMEDGTDPHLKNCSTGHQHRCSDLIIVDQFDQPCDSGRSSRNGLTSLKMLLAELLCWWLFQSYKSVTNILILSSRHFVSNLCHLHRPPQVKILNQNQKISGYK